MTTRDCGSCTKCCEGWLEATIRGYPMSPGTPCHFVQLGRGCTDYDHRPDDPCRGYRCAWLQDPAIPDALRPDRTGTILEIRAVQGMRYLMAVKAPADTTAELLRWAVGYTTHHGLQLAWQIGTRTQWLGEAAFSAAMAAMHPPA